MKREIPITLKQVQDNWTGKKGNSGIILVYENNSTVNEEG